MMMPSLKQKLLILLKNAARVAVVGIGSELRGDDAAGLLALEHLRQRLKIASPAKQQLFLESNGRITPKKMKTCFFNPIRYI